MTPPQEVPYGQGARWLALPELCQWLNITERHARKLVERDAIPYRKVGRLLRFPEPEVEQWSRPLLRPAPAPDRPTTVNDQLTAKPARARRRPVLPKSLIEWPPGQEGEHVTRRSA